MRKLFVYLALVCSSCVLNGVNAESTPPLLEIECIAGTLTAYRPSLDEMQRTAPEAKAIFQEAFATTYSEYHRISESTDSIEKWLRLREGLTLESWLSNVFDEEYEEYLLGTKSFIYLRDYNNNLIGWLSHSQVAPDGDVYLSQCALHASSRNQKIASVTFVQMFKDNNIKSIFPNVKTIKLIVRKINAIARRLYAHAGFVMDETIDPAVYGDSYDDRYVGYRLTIE